MIDSYKSGKLVVPKRRYGEFGRYAIAPVYTSENGDYEWCVWDRLHPNSTENSWELIIHATTKEYVFSLLDLDPDATYREL